MEWIWITGKRFGTQFSTFDFSRDHRQTFQSDDVQRNQEAVPEEKTKTIHTSEGRLNRGTIAMPTSTTRPLTTGSTMPVELPQNFMVGQQRQQISVLQFDKFTNLQSFVVWKFDSKQKSAMLWIKEVEMVDSLDEMNPRDQLEQRIFLTSKCWTRRLLLLWTRSSRIPSSRRRSASRSRKPRKKTGFYEEDRSRSWSATTFEWLAPMIQC